MIRRPTRQADPNGAASVKIWQREMRERGARPHTGLCGRETYTRRILLPDSFIFTWLLEFPRFRGHTFAERRVSRCRRTRSPYPPGFREQIVALARAGRSVGELAREFEPCAHTIHGWIRRVERDGGSRTDGLTSEEREELRRLRRENRQLRQERDILSKAAAWFAQESGATRFRSSDS